MNRRDRTSQSVVRSGFTLVEMIAVLVLVSIMSLTAIPSLARMDSARESALATECERLLRFARAAAVSSGLPTGLRIDLENQSIGVSVVDEAGEVASLDRDATGQPLMLGVADAFGGARLIEAGDSGSLASGGIVTIWFDFDGTPHSRDSDGSNPSDITRPFLIRTSGSRELSVSPITGRVER
jgi:prepilin-type N-terminal cleavage/methylation domain-containing protein